MRKIITQLISNPRRLFLIDGIGALVSAFSLGVLLVQFEHLFGMPAEVLFYLAFGASAFAIYSLTCHFRFPSNWRIFLKAIAISNLIYCGITLGLVFYYKQDLTYIGLAYFIIELVVIISLARIELKTANGNDA